MSRGGTITVLETPQALKVGVRGSLTVSERSRPRGGAASGQLWSRKQPARLVPQLTTTKVEDWFYDRYQSARVNGNRWFVTRSFSARSRAWLWWHSLP